MVLWWHGTSHLYCLFFKCCICVNVFVGGEDGFVKMWSRNGMLRSVLAQFPSAVYWFVRVSIKWFIFSSAAWDNTSTRVLYCNGDSCYIKSLKMQLAPLKWKAHEGLVLCCDWCPLSNVIVTGGEDCKFKVFSDQKFWLIYLTGLGHFRANPILFISSWFSNHFSRMESGWKSFCSGIL